MIYHIHEVSPEWRKYVHSIEAKNPEDAMEKFHNGEATLAADWPQGTFDASIESMDMEIDRIEVAG